VVIMISCGGSERTRIKDARDDNPRLTLRLRLGWQTLDLLAPESLSEREIKYLVKLEAR